MNLTEKHPDYIANIDIWQMIDDVCSNVAVKANKKKYLPVPESFGDSNRYDEYLQRAVFYGVTGTTLASYVGSAFNSLPAFNRPDDLSHLDINADGAGRSIYQVSQRMLRQILKNYRVGVYVDFPQVEASRSRADDKSKNAYPMIHVINAANVLDWDTVIIGNQRKISFVKIFETVTTRSDDGFTQEVNEQYRILRLRDGVYTVQVYKYIDGKPEYEDEQTPTDYNGRKWDYIPFTFCGAVDNSEDIHNPPVFDLADLNLAHYRNSADVEESGFIVGQPIYSYPNVTEEQYKLMQDENVAVGSSRGFPTKVEIVQAGENNLATALMEKKWAQMKEMGARLIEVGSGNKTATQAESDSSVQHSVISLAVSNISEALTVALRWCARYSLPNYDLDFDELSYTISQDFNKPTFSQEKAKRLYDACVAEFLPWYVWFEYEQTGVITEDNWDTVQIKLDQQRAMSPTSNYIPEM